MAKYTRDECVELVAKGEASFFDKRFTCCYIPGEDRVIMFADNGVGLEKHLTFKSKDGVVYGLPTTSPFRAWWQKATRVVGGVAGILGGPLGHFVAGFTGWDVAKLVRKLARVKAAGASDIEVAVRDHVGSHKAGRILLALEEAVRSGVATPDQAEELGKLLGGNE